MAAPQLSLNEGSQKDFVLADDTYSAYIGGLGSGKTYGGLARALLFALQPRVGYHGPRGVIAASSYPVLGDVIIPQFQEMTETLGVANWDRDYSRSTKTLTLPSNGATILFRSLDRPDWMRGVELSWFYIDEGRNVSMEAWKVLVGRLRQKGYKRAGWVASTPYGFDWMYNVFHPEAKEHQENWGDAKWYGAPTMENVHLPPEYVDQLKKGYSGRFYEQEIMGQFVGVIEGAVFPDWDPRNDFRPLHYNPKLPLYSFWDFGIGDIGVCIFAQVAHDRVRSAETGRTYYQPTLYILDVIEAKDWTSADWARAYKGALEFDFKDEDGNQYVVSTARDIGDPAGGQRNAVTGTSVIDDLNSRGVKLIASPKRPQDYSIRIIQNMMADHRLIVAEGSADRVRDALSHHHWSMKDGARVGVNPVHDWSSHFVDAIRYGVTDLFSYWDQEHMPEGPESYEPNMYGFVFEQLPDEADPDEYEDWQAAGRPRPTFIPGPITPRHKAPRASRPKGSN